VRRGTHGAVAIQDRRPHMEVRGKTGSPSDIFEPQRPSQILRDVVNIRKIWQVRPDRGLYTCRRMAKQPTTLGAFSRSLAVKDLQASQAFYETLDFQVIGGDAKQNWLIRRNGTVTIGLFQGMFERNILTFNPGWDDRAEALEAYTDIANTSAASRRRVSR
jgi:hypothetical protein